MDSEQTSKAEAIGAHWNQQVVRERPIRWMTHPWVATRVNQHVGGIDSSAWGAGLMARMKAALGAKKSFKRGISVACGKGLIELALVRQGLVDEFDCFDFAEDRLEGGRAKARQFGLENKVRYHCADAFAAATAEGSYDFVHWRNALHHMMDTRAAVAWSHRLLASGGYVYVDDYVGPSRFQYTDAQMASFNLVRARLPGRFFESAQGDKKARKLKRPVAEDVIRVDPSEAADSAGIVPALREYFPAATIVPVSGGLFQAGLHDIMGNFDAERDAEVLEWLWTSEQLLMASGHLNWIAAFARKP